MNAINAIFLTALKKNSTPADYIKVFFNNIGKNYEDIMLLAINCMQ